MQVRLLNHSPLWVCASAIRMSRDNFDKSDSFPINPQGAKCPRCEGKVVEKNGYLKCEGCGRRFSPNDHTGPKDRELIDRVGNKLKHESVLEQLVYWFEIDGISRAALQELARHRTARLTVKSTRYTLKEIRNLDVVWFDDDGSVTDDAYETAERLCVVPPDLTGIEKIRTVISYASALGEIATMRASNDVTKYLLPEAFKVKLQWQIDMRNLRNFLRLRLDKSALWEMRKLARKIAEALPEDHRYLIEDLLH